MKRIYITFSGKSYDPTTKLIVENAERFGADKLLVYDDKWLLGTEFYAHNKWLWETPDMRGFGWFCWKPYIIMHALDNYCEPGDIVLYTDADTYPIAPLSEIYREPIGNGGIMLFAAEGCSDREWVKFDCRVVMGQEWDTRPELWDTRPKFSGDLPDTRPEFARDAQHAVARFMLFQKGPWKPRQLLMEWLTYCVNPSATTFEPSVIDDEYSDLHQHRTEQAILSLLSHKYGYRLYREACQFGNAALFEHGKDAWYPQLFIQDGTRIEANPTDGSTYRNVG